MVHWLENEKFDDKRKRRLCKKLRIDPNDFRLTLDFLVNKVIPKVLNIEGGCTITLHSPDIHRDFPKDYWLCRIEPTMKCIGLLGGWVSQEENKTPELALVKTMAVALQVW